MLFPQSKAPIDRDVRTISMSDGQQFKIVVAKPTFVQRFNDEGRHLFVVARNGTGDTWSEYQLGRVRDVVTDWEEVYSAEGRKIPFTVDRLLSLFEHDQKIVEQVMAIVTEMYRPLGRTSLEASAPTPAASGEATHASTETPSDSTAISTAQPDSAEPSDSPSVN